jgi:hypothetical protein
MKKMILWFTLILISIIAYTQEADSTRSVQINSAEKLLSQNGKLQIGGYGEVHFNQPLNPETRENAILDVHRIVLLVGYHFDKKTQFVTELEFEHVTELYVEQAFLQYKLNKFINLRGGLLLVPMGIINEYHEPTTFHGVERPMIDKYIAPTTWREIGFGATGSILPAYIRYQIYLMTGLNGFDGTARLSGSNPFRS